MFSVVLMGVSGSGKSTIGQAIAKQLNGEFVDGDDLHPEANIQKMASGQSLDDDDRHGWLCAIRDLLKEKHQEGTSLFVACSALKPIYRDLLSQAGDHVRFLYLHVDRETLLQRMEQRENHFMPPALLDSQLATLEISAECLQIDATQAVEKVVQAAAAELSAS